MGVNSAACLASTSGVDVDRRARLVLLGWLYSSGKIRSEHDKKKLEDYKSQLDRWKWKRKFLPPRFRGKRPRRPRINPPNSWSFDTNFREYVRREISGRRGGKSLLKAFDLSTAKGRAKEWRRIKQKIKQRAWRAILGSKAKMVKKAIKIVKAVKNIDPVDIVKRKIRAALSIERRQTFDIGGRLRLNVTVRTNLFKVHVGAKLHLLKPLHIPVVLRFETREDERVCPICGPCHMTTLPKVHRWWQTHIPPMHHGCRCTIRALSTKEAAKWAKKHEGERPLDMEAPKVRAHKTFGRDPNDPKNEWKPNLKNFPPEMRDIVDRKLKQNQRKQNR